VADTDKGISFNVTIEGATDPGSKYVTVDTNELRTLCAECDNPATGHVSVKPVGDEATSKTLLEEWAATRGTGKTHSFTQELLDAMVGDAKKRPKN
jgi:hypothetical protein